MELLGRYMLGGVFVGIGVFIIASGRSKIDVLRELGNERARKITVDAFIGMLGRGVGDIDSMILEFENSKETDLGVFAKKRGRTREGYVMSYGSYYEEAKKKYRFM